MLVLQWSFSCKICKILQESCKIIFLQDLTKYCKKIILQFFLARKASLLVQDLQVLVQDLQDLVQELASHARKILARFGYFLQDGFYWEIILYLHVIIVNTLCGQPINILVLRHFCWSVSVSVGKKLLFWLTQQNACEYEIDLNCKSASLQ